MTIFGICFTVNNYTDASIRAIRGCIGKRGITYVIYGREVGVSGTPHLQGYLQSSQKQFDRLKKAIGEAHMEAAKGTDVEAAEYCKKDGDWWEAGEQKPLPRRGQGARADLDAVKEAIDRGESYDEICEAHFETAAKYGRFIKERVQAKLSNEQLEGSREHFETTSLYKWQRRLDQIVKADPDPRKIMWFWETVGNMGKSWMANYLGCLLGATVLTAGKKVDMAFIFAQKPTKIVVFDLSRTTEPVDGKSFLDGIYSLAEDLKNGRVVSTKYESKTVYFQSPHVIFFANFEPDHSKWSADRYAVHMIKPTDI